MASPQTPSDSFARLCPADLGDALAPRTRALNGTPLRGGRYVLCWLQQTLRPRDNPAIDAAIAVGNRMGLPVLVYHGMREDYPYSSWRLHDFLVGASVELQKGCRERGLRSVNLVVRPGKEERGLVYRLADDAALVVTDDQPLFVGRWQANRFAAKTDAPVWAVDTNRLVPFSLMKSGIRATRSFREKAKTHRDGPWSEIDDLEPDVGPYRGKLAFASDDLADLSKAKRLALIRECRIDHTLLPSAEILPTRKALDGLLGNLQNVVLPVYANRRNNPALVGSASFLSPYLHFGMVGPREIYRIVQETDTTSRNKWKYLDELLTWREWFHYLAQDRDSVCDWANIPNWARQTLEEHAGDAREQLYSLSELLHAQTDDPVWNAAQRQFLLDGYMHNNLRMYWGKQIIKWTPDPKTAWSTACYINDRLSYDGRNPATYGNIEWVFGRARPGYREIPVYGRVAPKSNTAILKRDGMPDWIETMNARETIEVSVPNRVPDYAEPETPLGPYFPMRSGNSRPPATPRTAPAGERSAPKCARACADVG